MFSGSVALFRLLLVFEEWGEQNYCLYSFDLIGGLLVVSPRDVSSAWCLRNCYSHVSNKHYLVILVLYSTEFGVDLGFSSSCIQ